MIFSKKKFFLIFSISFLKGGPFDVEIVKKKFFPFFKNLKNKTQKLLSWDHSNINRNKVMNFGGRSSYPVETARPFMVIWAIMAPLCPDFSLTCLFTFQIKMSVLAPITPSTHSGLLFMEIRKITYFNLKLIYLIMRKINLSHFFTNSIRKCGLNFKHFDLILD